MKTYFRDKAFEVRSGVDIIVLWSWQLFGVLSVGNSIEIFLLVIVPSFQLRLSGPGLLVPRRELTV